jgi:hypothetical protein
VTVTAALRRAFLLGNSTATPQFGSLEASSVASSDNEGWSLYGAPWLQPVASGRKSVGVENLENKPKPLPWVATSCRAQRMVRRGSTVRVRQRALQKPRKAALLLSGALARSTACSGYGALYGAFRSKSVSVRDKDGHIWRVALTRRGRQPQHTRHAGGRGFESRRFRRLPANSRLLCRTWSSRPPASFHPARIPHANRPEIAAEAQRWPVIPARG